MTFISLQFLLFFIFVSFVYFILPHKLRWLFLLIVSSLFYMSFIPVYILVLFTLIFIDFFAGILISKSTGKKKTIFLVLSIISTISTLFIFKYFNFFSINLEKIALFIDWNYSAKLLKLALPVGLSFHTFQSLAYVIEVYKGRQKPERHFGIYALYVMFYPQLMAGPIERPFNMLHQFYEKHEFDYNRVISGLRLMLWGTFQKIIIADRIAGVVNLIYKTPTNYQGLPLLLATILFSFQIYCDFAGYSNIARGIARVIGFNLMKNFNSPYLATSIKDFWKRWHISLSTWFRDYFYIPLGGSRVSNTRKNLNLMATFLVSGLWHGANWTFVFWGGLHGLFMIVFTIVENLVKKFVKVKSNVLTVVDKIIQTLITFSLVTFCWILFRADSLKDALYIINNQFTGLGADLSLIFKTDLYTLALIITQKQKLLGLTFFSWVMVFVSITTMIIIEIINEKRSFAKIFDKMPILFRWAIYYILVIIIIFFTSQGKEQFIYFQF